MWAHIGIYIDIVTGSSGWVCPTRILHNLTTPKTIAIATAIKLQGNGQTTIRLHVLYMSFFTLMQSKRQY